MAFFWMFFQSLEEKEILCNLCKIFPFGWSFEKDGKTTGYKDGFDKKLLTICTWRKCSPLKVKSLAETQEWQATWQQIFSVLQKNEEQSN